MPTSRRPSEIPAVIGGLQLVTRRDRRGYARREWQKTRERNEALDCYVYARAAAAILGLDRMTHRHWRQRAAELGAMEPPLASEATPTAELAPAPVPVRTKPEQAERRTRDPWLSPDYSSSGGERDVNR